MIISVFTPHGGCPERCTFCDQSVSGGEPVSAAKVTQSIEQHLGSNVGIADEIAFYGGTFTAMPRSRQLAYLEAAKPYLDAGRIRCVRLSTRPDALDRNWLTELKERFRLSTVELGVQSFHQRSLESLGRTHTIEQIEAAMLLLKDLGLRSSLHMMLGCPRERVDEDAHTIASLLRLKPDFVRLHPLLVLKGTPLEAQYRSGEFAPLELEEAIRRAALLVPAIEAAGIAVIRIGLQPNELLGQAIVAGAYHPAFGDLVRGRIWRNRIGQQLASLTADAFTSLTVRVPARYEGTIRGPRSENLIWLERRYKLKELRLQPVEGLTELEFLKA